MLSIYKCIRAVSENDHFKKLLSIAKFCLNFLFFLICCFYGLRLFQYHSKILTSENLMEYREGAMVMSSNLLASGESPYSAQNQPIFSNNYGALYPLICMPIIFFFGPNLILFRLVAAIFIWLTLLLLTIVLIKNKVPILYVFAGVLILFASLLYSTTPLIRPDSLGLFLFIASIFFPYLYKYSNKSLIASAILAVLGFYAKPYFILAAPLLASSLLLIGLWKKGVIYSILAGGFFTLSFLIIKHGQEFYFYNTLYVNMAAASNSREYTILQLSKFISINKGLLFALGFSILCILYSILTEKKNLITNHYKSAWLPLSCLLVASLLTYFKLGGYNGAYMIYLFHLLTPFLIISALLLASSLRNSLFYKIPLFIFLSLNIYSGFAFLPGFNCENEKEWNELESLTKEHKHILSSPVLSVTLLRNNKQIYDSGLTEYFYTGDDNNITSFFYNNEEKRKRLYDDLKNEITKDVQQHNFDLIIFARGYERFVRKGILSENYKLEKTITLCLPHTMQKWELDVYKPKM